MKTALSKTGPDKLKEIKDKVENAYQYFSENNRRFHEFMRFVFYTSLSNEDIGKLQALQMPTLEFNILEAIVSRLRGEFAKCEPGIKVGADESVRPDHLTPQFIELMQVLEGHIRHIVLNNATNDGLQYDIFTDLLGGGYSVTETFVDFIHEMSFEKKIINRRVFDPTLTYFDPLARESHKGDGQFCGQFYPKTEDEFLEIYPEEALKEMKFTRGFCDFSWSYASDSEKVILIGDHYEKEYKKTKIFLLTTGHVIKSTDYDELLRMWFKLEYPEQPPAVLDERWTQIETIVKYEVCETKILSRKPTTDRYFGLVFFDGNSVKIQDSDGGSAKQVTRPYTYHAKGTQRLKNFSGQKIGAEIENMLEQKWVVAVEAIPKDFTDAYRNPQQSQVLMYNQFQGGNPNVRLDPPREVQRTPTPPIVESTFMSTDATAQAVTGSYDAILGVNDKDVSGRGIQMGAIQSSAASAPYHVGYIKGLNRLIQVNVDLISRNYIGPRALPIRSGDGKAATRIINTPGIGDSIDLKYTSYELNIQIEAGVNTALEKQFALDQLIRLCQTSEQFSNFISTMGLEVFLDNLEIRNVDHLKMLATQFMQQQQELQEQQAQTPDPMVELAQGQIAVEQAKVEQRAEEAEGNLAIQAAKVAIEKQKVDAQVMKIAAEIGLDEARLVLEEEKVDSENSRTAVDSAIELTKTHHSMNMANQERLREVHNG